MAGHINSFAVGDIVISTLVSQGSFTGIIKEVQPKLNKVMVAWGGGSLCQHDPEEIQLHPRQTELLKSRMAARRMAMETEQAEENPQYVGDPKVNGLDEPRGGGFSIMQDLAKAQKKESLEQATGNPKVSPVQASLKTAKKKNLRTKVVDNHGNEYDAYLEDGKLGAILKVKGKYGGSGWYLSSLLNTSDDKIYLDYGQGWYVTGLRKLLDEARKHIRQIYTVASEMKSRRAMYWCGPGRKYRMTKGEIASGKPRCPKCCADMGRHPYTRRSKLYICDDCGFKISSNDVLTEKPVEAVPVEPEVTVASLKSRR
jgi:predicted RNA-binding Zn-ribbon protein involved in translation (DUF1610 family)